MPPDRSKMSCPSPDCPSSFYCSSIEMTETLHNIRQKSGRHDHTTTLPPSGNHKVENYEGQHTAADQDLFSPPGAINDTSTSSPGNTGINKNTDLMPANVNEGTSLLGNFLLRGRSKEPTNTSATEQGPSLLPASSIPSQQQTQSGRHTKHGSFIIPTRPLNSIMNMAGLKNMPGFSSSNMKDQHGEDKKSILPIRTSPLQYYEEGDFTLQHMYILLAMRVTAPLLFNTLWLTFSNEMSCDAKAGYQDFLWFTFFFDLYYILVKGTMLAMYFHAFMPPLTPIHPIFKTGNYYLFVVTAMLLQCLWNFLWLWTDNVHEDRISDLNLEDHCDPL